MPADITFTDFSADVLKAINVGGQQYVAAVAVNIRETFQENAHVVTGAMQASASVITADSSEYPEHVAAASDLNPKAEFAPEEPVGPLEAAVQVPVDYAGFEELGTTRQPAHPAFVPAVESAIANAESIAREVFGR